MAIALLFISTRIMFISQKGDDNHDSWASVEPIDWLFDVWIHCPYKHYINSVHPHGLFDCRQMVSEEKQWEQRNRNKNLDIDWQQRQCVWNMIGIFQQKSTRHFRSRPYFISFFFLRFFGFCLIFNQVNMSERNNQIHNISFFHCFIGIGSGFYYFSSSECGHAVWC